MGLLFSGSLKATPDNINKFKQMLKEGNPSKVPKYMKKVKDAIDINQPSVLFRCECHEEAIPLLHYTAAKCPTVMVMTVCDLGEANINVQTSHGVTPLMYAIMHNNSENILPLHLRKCDLNAKDNHEGDTAFHYACKKGYLDCVEGLIKAGADIEQKNKYGKTGLDCAQFNGHEAVVRHIENHAQSHLPGQSNPLHQELKETVAKVVEEKLGEFTRHSVYEYPTYTFEEGQGNNGRRPPSGSSSHVDNGSTTSGLPSPSETKDDPTKRKKATLQGGDKDREVKSRTLPAPRPRQGSQTGEPHDGVSPVSPPKQEAFPFDLADSKHRNPSMASSLSNIPDEASYEHIPYIDGEETEDQRGATGGMQPLKLTQEPTYRSSRLQDVIRTKYPHLKDVMKPDRILDKMYANCIMDDDEHIKVKQKDVADKNDFILKKVINGPENLAKMLINMLRETGQSDVANSIMVKKSSSETNLTRLSYATYYYDMTC